MYLFNFCIFRYIRNFSNFNLRKRFIYPFYRHYAKHKILNLQDVSWSEKIALTLAHEHTYKNVILAANTGFRLILHLQNAGFKHIYAWDYNILPEEIKLVNFNDGISISKDSFFSNRQLAFSVFPFKGQNKTVIKNMFEILPKTTWSNEVSSVSVVGILPYSQSNLYVANLIKSLSHKSGLFSLGRVVQYIIVNGMEKELMCNDNFHARCTRHPFYHLFFETDVLLKIPVEAFSGARSKNGWKLKAWDKNHMYLIRMVPKQEIYSSLCPINQMTAFINFTKVLYHSPNQRLIPLIESYVSNCGIELLRHGFTMFTKCGDLRTSQYSEIFQILYGLPQYSSSGLHALIEQPKEQSEYEL